MSTIRQLLQAKRCTPIDIPEHVLDSKPRSGIDVTFEMPCHHSKTIRALSLRKGLHCRICYFQGLYGYSVEERTLTCPKCEYIHVDVADTNLHAYQCWHCQDPESSTDYRFLHAFHEYVKSWESPMVLTRTAQFPKEAGRKIRTADCSVIFNGRRYLIEIDDASHLRGPNLIAHLEKDNSAIRNDLRLIRVHACEAVAQVPLIYELIENDEIAAEVTCITGSEKTRAFYSKIEELEAAAEAAAEDAIAAAIEAAAAADAGAAIEAEDAAIAAEAAAEGDAANEAEDAVIAAEIAAEAAAVAEAYNAAVEAAIVAAAKI